MLLGKQVRLNRLFNRTTGNLLSIAMDHGVAYSFFDLPHGLECVPEVLPKIIAGQPDALVFQKGMAAHVLAPFAGQVGWIMQCSVYTPHMPGVDHQIAWVEDAIALGADAIAMTITVGDDGQGREVADLGRLVTEARGVGLPVVAHVYPKGNQVPPGGFNALPWVRYAGRVGAEAGVDIVKIPYTGSPESFAEVVACTPMPVIASGGPRMDSFEDVLVMVRGVMDAGARGVAMGRNVWGATNIGAVMAALRAIIHENASAEAATDLFHNLTEPDKTRQFGSSNISAHAEVVRQEG